MQTSNKLREKLDSWGKKEEKKNKKMTTRKEQTLLDTQKENKADKDNQNNRN